MAFAQICLTRHFRLFQQSAQSGRRTADITRSSRSTVEAEVTDQVVA
jgi:hypothetical protein